MNGAYDGRLAKLEVIFGPSRCPVCRGWVEHLTVCVDERGNATRPERCPACGRLVPIRHTLTLVGIDLGDV